MTDSKKTPDPLEDLREGLGLLFRAARTAVEKLPTKDLEEAVVSGAKEVERAVKSVAEAVESQFAGAVRKPSTPPEPEGEAPKGNSGIEALRVESDEKNDTADSEEPPPNADRD